MTGCFNDVSKAEISLRQQGEQWIIVSESSGTHGLAHLLAVRDIEQVTGRVKNGRKSHEVANHAVENGRHSETALTGMLDHAQRRTIW